MIYSKQILETGEEDARQDSGYGFLQRLEAKKSVVFGGILCKHE